MQTAVFTQLLKKQLTQGNTVQLQVISNSMAPLIKAGDMVEITAVSPSQLKRGDIVTVITENSLLTHRLVRINKETHMLWLRGEWQGHLEQFEFVDCLGKVTAVQKGSNWIYLTHHRWRIIFVIHFHSTKGYLFVKKQLNHVLTIFSRSP